MLMRAWSDILLVDECLKCLDCQVFQDCYHSYSINSQECTSVGWTKAIRVGSQSDDSRLFHSFGVQVAQLRGPKLDIWQASKSPRVAEHRWQRLVLTVTEMHSFWRYCGAVWWRHLKVNVQNLKTILSGTGNQWRSSRSVGVMCSNFRFCIMTCTAECKTDCNVFVTVVFIWYNTLLQ